MQRVEQPLIVARMQADRRFVENVEHADQAAADLAGQANALRFAAGERRGGAIEREIFEPDIDQETQPAADFLQHFFGDFPSSGVELQFAEKLAGVADRQAANLGQRATGLVGEMRDGVVVTVTLRACGFSRAPSQAAQPITLMYFSNCRRCILLFEVRYRDSSCGMMPSKCPPYFVPAAPLRQVNVMCSSPVPQSQSCCSSGSRSRHGVSSIVPGVTPSLRSIVSATP